MIKIVTDSMCSLSDDIFKRHQITMVPAYVTFPTETLRDRVDLSPADFYKKLVANHDLPTTSQPSVGDFETVYRQVLDSGATTIMSIHMTASLSGTIESARQAAARLPDADIRIVDTRSISLGQGLMVVEAAQMAERGQSMADILKMMQAMRNQTGFYFALDTLEYLAKGGRIGRAARLMGMIMNMKPVIKIEDGALEPHDRYISWARAMDALRQIAFDHRQPHLKMAVVHADREADALLFAEELKRTLTPDTMLVGDVGPAIGVHTGPGAIGIAWSVADLSSRTTI